MFDTFWAENFWGNPAVVEALDRMAGQDRIPQSMLFAGPDGVGKATLARRFGARLLGDPEQIEHDDLSLPHNVALQQAREKLAAEKRNDDPFLLSSHPDFTTFAPDGPLAQISIQQIRLLKERAPFAPSHGSRKIFLVDHMERANVQAANSLLKILEEPPPHLIVILTAANPYDLLPTIRSRAVPFFFTPLSDEEMLAFAKARRLDHIERRVALAAGSPGTALSLDLEVYDKRRTAMLALLQAAVGAAPFQAWMKHSESIARSKSEKLEFYVRMLYGLLRDLLILREGGGAIRNQDIRTTLEPLAQKVGFEWLRAASAKVDELNELARRNIQKTIAFDALLLDLRSKV